MAMGNKEYLGHRAPHHGVEATVTQVLLPLKANVVTPRAQRQLTAVSQDQKSEFWLFYPIPTS